MMLDAETRAVYLAEAQVRGDSWRTPDKDEGELPTTCEVCLVPLVPRQIRWQDGRLTWRNPTKGSRLCPECIRIGWRNAPCVVCAGPTRTWNWTSKRRGETFRGYCPTCRAEAHQDRELVG